MAFENLAAFLKILVTGGHSVIAFGDTNHLHPDMHALKQNMEFYEAVSMAPFENIAIEQTTEQGAIVDFVQRSFATSGNVDPQKEMNELEALGIDPIIIAQGLASSLYGFQLHAVDIRTSILVDDALVRAHEAISLTSKIECKDVFFQAHLNKNPDDRKLLVEYVFDKDEEIAIKTKESVKEANAFLFFGNNHFADRNDMDELLAELFGVEVIHIPAITSREAGYKLSGNDDVVSDYPEYIYVMDEDAVLPFDINDPEIQAILDNYRSYKVADLPKETLERCTEELPASLKGSFLPNFENE